MRKINLIPKELSVPPQIVKTSAIISKISIFLGILLVITILTTIGILIFYSFKLNDLKFAENNLKQRVGSLQQSEQRLFLAKDRIAKITKIRANESLSDDVLEFRKFSDAMAGNPDVSFSEISLDSKSSEISLISRTTNALSLIFSFLKATKTYENISLSSLGFNPGSGYILSLLFE